MILGAEKPPLDDELLIHFGIKGMRWGVRKERRSGRSGSSKPMSTRKKVAIGVATGVAIAGGAVAAAYLLKTRGEVKLPKVNPEKPLGKLGPNKPLSQLPSPFELRLQAARASHRNLMNRIGNQRLTDQTWRDSAKLSLLTRDMDKTTSSLMRGTGDNLSAVRRALQDPNHVWRL